MLRIILNSVYCICMITSIQCLLQWARPEQQRAARSTFRDQGSVDGHYDDKDDVSDVDREDVHNVDSEEEDIVMRRRQQQYEPPMMSQGMHMDENIDDLDDEGDDEFCIIDDPGLGISVSLICWPGSVVNPLSVCSFKCLMFRDDGGRVCSYIAALTSSIPLH